MIRVLVVDDSALVRRRVTEILHASADIRVIATAQDPYVAAARMRQSRPDVIVLDVEMPRMDGITFLRKIMAQHPIPVVILSGQVTRDSPAALAALEEGAVEVLAKGEMANPGEAQRAHVLDAVRGAAGARLVRRTQSQPPARTRVAAVSGGHWDGTRLVVIGASTGGTEAIRRMLQLLPAHGPPVAIVQHMPAGFTRAFARRLDQLCPAHVKEAEEGDALLPGRVLVAPGGRHLVLRRRGAGFEAALQDGPLVMRHRPSVDVLFRSAAECAGDRAAGVILTGMGEDGARGLLAMREAGARTLGQDETSSVVYGMPRAALALGALQSQWPIDELMPAVLHALQGPASRHAATP
ncbi:MAG: protein-glutamate methylesterase/protein-glutamine glutaminase [Halothiobacillaceae bacterium]